MEKFSLDIWNEIIAQALLGCEMTIPKRDSSGESLPTPLESGLFKKSIGEPKGQIADWRASVEGSQRGVHVVEYQDRYSVHVDRFDPSKQPVKHLIFDSPKTGATLALVGIGATAALRLLLKRRRKR